MEKIEYRVRPVTRYHVTRFEQSENSVGSTGCGEFDNERTAYDVAYALCKADHLRLGWPLSDPRIQYPVQPIRPDEVPEPDSKKKPRLSELLEGQGRCQEHNWSAPVES